jgi:hypothetical protein
MDGDAGSGGDRGWFGSDLYILEGHTPVRVYDFDAWGEWFMRADRRVARSRKFTGHVKISTVFLGMDHGFFPHEKPLVFETMIFGGACSGWCWRYRTWDDAVRGHRSAVRRAIG